jgi:hypothetical protein
MERARNSGTTEPISKEYLIKVTKNSENLSGQTGRLIKVNLIKTNYKEKGNLPIRTIDITRANGNKI